MKRQLMLALAASVIFATVLLVCVGSEIAYTRLTGVSLGGSAFLMGFFMGTALALSVILFGQE